MLRTTLALLIAFALLGCSDSDPKQESAKAPSGPPAEFQALLEQAESGDPKAQYDLGVIYERGKGVPKDLTEAVKWWRRAAEQGHARAQWDLVTVHMDRFPPDYKEVAKWYRKLAEQGHAAAMLDLADMYINGEGVPRDEKVAFRWTLKAAEQGHAGAQLNTGVNYGVGFGGPQDDVAAYAWYDVAAETLSRT